MVGGLDLKSSGMRARCATDLRSEETGVSSGVEEEDRFGAIMLDGTGEGSGDSGFGIGTREKRLPFDAAELGGLGRSDLGGGFGGRPLDGNAGIGGGFCILNRLLVRFVGVIVAPGGGGGSGPSSMLVCFLAGVALSGSGVRGLSGHTGPRATGVAASSRSSASSGLTTPNSDSLSS